jgi:hypothetical protein
VVLIGPFVALRGGIGTKPAVARLLGLAPPARRDAVERERPLEAGRTTAATLALGARAAGSAVAGAVTWPLVPLALIGLATTAWRRWSTDARISLLVTIMLLGALAALVRLHATGGYCTPRHALLIALPLFAAAASGLRSLAAAVAWLIRRRPLAVRVVAWLPAAVGCALMAPDLRELREPPNMAHAGYREAGAWLAAHVPPGARVVDVTGWSLFYGERPGYVFANLDEALVDQDLRWVVAREAHTRGPWHYCTQLRTLIAGATPVAQFPVVPRARTSRVTIYERPVRRDSGSP